MGVQTKDPAAVLDWLHSWTSYLQASETITTSTWAITPTTTSPLTVDSEEETSSTTTVWLSGGLLGQVYRVTNTITTNQGRTEERTIVVRVDNL